MMKVIMMITNKKKFKIWKFGIALSLILSGCYWNSPVIDLLSPPKLTVEQTEVFNALANTKGTSLTLKYPKTGEFLSAFVFRDDADSTGVSRVMVFNELSGISAEPTIWLTFLEKKNGQWKSTNEIPLFATDIEKVEFSRLGDGLKENIIISTSVLNRPDRSLWVIAYNEYNEPKEVYKRDFCVYYEISDYDNSGNNMLLSINRSRVEATDTTVDLAKWSNGEFTTSFSIQANPDANEYVKVLKDFSETGRKSAFFEYVQSDTSYNTGIIRWDDGNPPRNVVYADDEIRRNENLNLLGKRPNKFTAYAYARDIDGNGEINPAGNRPFPGYEHESIPSTEWARAAIWYTVNDDDGLDEVYYTFLGINNDYVFFFPEDWKEKVTVKIDSETGEVGFWEYDSENHRRIDDVEKQLLSIITVEKGKKPLQKGYSLFDSFSNKQFDYYVKITDSSIRMKELKKMLIIL